MQNYQVGYQPNIQTKTQTQAVPAAQNNTATGATGAFILGVYGAQEHPARYRQTVLTEWLSILWVLL